MLSIIRYTHILPINACTEKNKGIHVRMNRVLLRKLANLQAKFRFVDWWERTLSQIAATFPSCAQVTTGKCVMQFWIKNTTLQCFVFEVTYGWRSVDGTCGAPGPSVRERRGQCHCLQSTLWHGCMKVQYHNYHLAERTTKALSFGGKLTSHIEEFEIL